MWAQQGGRAAPAATPPAASQRVVSLNLCADQLLIALADRDRIAGLTRNATDPGMSAAAAAARGLPLIRNTAEQILVAAPDLVVGMPASGSAAVAALPHGSFRTLDLPTANSFDVIRRTIRLTATALGHPARGEALIARMERDLAGVPRPGRGRVAAYYQRRGYMTGTGTLIDEMMGRVGLVNLAAKLGKPPLSQLSLEEMVAANPDFLIVESASDTITDQGSEMLHHPALRGIPRLSVPEAWTVCGGPAYGPAVRRLAEQIQRHDGARR
ncbi:ABC transporter substrate-binding protein [Sphingopyxis granuli]|nr:ABC transporter substrate-binding protein [Sphingopyxis granuli]UNK81273.1 ABC transporter substrate-binding protein [Sphingopyxis granuli]